MIATVAKWGNSLAVRLPAQAARDLAVAEGAQMELAVEGGALILRPVAPSVVYDLDKLLAGITGTNQHGEISTGQARGSEL